MTETDMTLKSSIDQILTYKCNYCSVASKSDYGFFKGEKTGKTECWTCQQYRLLHENRKNRGSLIAMFFFWGLFAIFQQAQGGTGLGILYFNFVLFVMFGYITGIVHEFAHALVCWLYKQKVFIISLGHDNSAWEKVIGSTLIRVCVNPLGGFVQHGANKPVHYVQEIFIALAGPIANLFFAIVILLIGWDTFLNEGIFSKISPITALVLVNIYNFLYNLWPSTMSMQNMKIRSDGGQIFDLLFLRKQSEEYSLLANDYIQIYVLISGRRYSDALDIVKKYINNSSEEINMIPNYIYLLIQLKKYDLATTICEQYLEQELEDYIRAIVANNLAWIIFQRRDMESINKAKELSDYSLSVHPWNLAYRSTQAGVLYLLGDYEKSISICKDYRYVIESKENRGLIHTLLAKCYEKLDDEKNMKKQLGIAKKLDRNFFLFGSVE